MKGLRIFPSACELQSAYRSLQFKDKKTDENQIALWAQWTRLDPRLGEILILWFSKNYKELSAIKLNTKVMPHPWPQCLGVLLDQALLIVPSNEKKIFKAWARTATCNISTPFLGEYFVSLLALNPKKKLNEALRCIKPYSNWGFLGSYILINKWKNNKQSLLSKKQRKILLLEFIKTKQQFNVNEYLEFLNTTVSRRVAELDLQSSKLIKSKGFTNNKTYFKIP